MSDPIVTRDGDYLVITYASGAIERVLLPEGTVIAAPPRTITELQIKRALTDAERAAIRAAVQSDGQVADWMDYVQSAMRSGESLLVEDEALRAGFLRLRDLGVFTTERLLELQAQLLA